ncbi:MAG: hypothetical protein JWP92_150 [Caulobacter sp.]|nr:hypothetical protein [Caulobacter sp.]
MSSRDLETFLATPDAAIAAYGQARAEAVGLALPATVQAGVFDNLALLRTQTALVAAALAAPLATGADGGPTPPFRP